MFAVPGWSLSADKLKPETAAPVAAAAADDVAAAPPSSKGNKKRKRSKITEAVTVDNVANLWERVIENRAEESGSKDKKDKKDKEDKKDKKKRQKLENGNAQDAGSGSSKADESAPKSVSEKPKKELKPTDSEKKDGKKKKDKKKKDKNGEKKDTKTPPSEEKVNAPKPAAAVAAPAPAPAPAPTLTPLQASMRAKLISARFRHLNETLYTRQSADAFKLFAESPEMFDEYHEGFRQQVGVWPENPVDGYIADIRARAAIMPDLPHFAGAKFKKKHQPGPEQQALQQQAQQRKLQAIPRNMDGICRVADLGCGDGRLGAELRPMSSKRYRVEVLSFDLQSPAPHVTAADMANLPLKDGSVDVAIFCLALMGTNWPAFVEEAYRVLRWKGELWVAEIKSRFAPSGRQGKNGVVDHSVGNRRKKAAAGKKGKGGGGDDDEPDRDQALAVAVDGADDLRSDTDVSAFVDVLKRRGFLLYGSSGGEPSPDAIDLSNKMFVKMRFQKAAAPVVGKGVPKAKPQMPDRLGGGRFPPKRVIDTTDVPDPEIEAKTLKPCVYKIR